MELSPLSLLRLFKTNKTILSKSSMDHNLSSLNVNVNINTIISSNLIYEVDYLTDL